MIAMTTKMTKRELEAEIAVLLAENEIPKWKLQGAEDGLLIEQDQVRIIERRQQGGSSGNQQNAEDRLAALLEEYDLARDAGMSAVEAALKANRLLDTHDFKASRIEKAPDGNTEKPGKRLRTLLKTHSSDDRS